MITDAAVTKASYGGGAVSVLSALTLTDWGIIVGIVTALLTFGLNVLYQARKDGREQREHIERMRQLADLRRAQQPIDFPDRRAK